MTPAPPFDTLRLTAGAAELVLAPAAGGAILSWRVDGQPMLHDARVPAASGWNPLDMASFPLVPFSNRIGGGAFLWDGVRHQLPPSALPDRHAIHGVGWRRAWRVVESAADRALLRHEHDASADWPWAYAAEQRFRLTAFGLEIAMTATNAADRPVPLAFGLHPYFDAAGAHLRFAASPIWRSGIDGLPARSEPPGADRDFREGLAVTATDLDNGYDGWDGRAAIWWADRPYALRITSDLPCAVVYTPASERFFCFEPVPHSNNALNLAGEGRAMPVVTPGEVFSADVRFEVLPREALQ